MVTGIIHETIPSYRIYYLPERFNENLWKPSKLNLEANNQFLKKTNFFSCRIERRNEITDDENIENCAKQCKHCTPNTLLPMNMNGLVFHEIIAFSKEKRIYKNTR